MELNAELISSIKNAVHQNFAKQIEFTQKIVQLGGQRGDEGAAQDIMFSEYAARGYKAERLVMDKDVLSKHPTSGKFSATHSTAPVVVATHQPRSATAQSGNSLVLNGHIDVVPVGPEDLWQAGPYSGLIDGDWLYGRGSGDMRAGLVANMFALDALRTIGKQPASRVVLEAVPEEESTGNGTMTAHLAGYSGDTVIIPEPTGENLVRANVGVLWFQIEVKGRPVHVATMGEGSNAITSAWKLTTKLQELEREMNDRKKEIPYFENLDHPINLNLAMIQGGDWASSVPAWCRIDCRIAIYPGTNPEEVASAIEQAVKAAAREDPFLVSSPPKVHWNGFFAEGYVLQPGSDAETLLATAHQHATQTTLSSTVAPAYLDGRIFATNDKIPALCYGPISENIHGIDERVSISSIQRVTVAIALFIASWCGLEDIA